jgi:cobalt-precorrin 5A hydrolase
MGGDKTVIFAGLGFRGDTRADDLLAVIHDAGIRAGCAVDAIAVPDFKADDACAQAAATLGLKLIRVSRDALKGEQGRCLTRSDVAEKATGFACVAEAAALAAAGPGGRLLLPRIATQTATCALAERP